MTNLTNEELAAIRIQCFARTIIAKRRINELKAVEINMKAVREEEQMMQQWIQDSEMRALEKKIKQANLDRKRQKTIRDQEIEDFELEQFGRCQFGCFGLGFTD